jgi:hypothetical protein
MYFIVKFLKVRPKNFKSKTKLIPKLEVFYVFYSQIFKSKTK